MSLILTVTLNPVIDIHYFTEEFQTGRDNLVSCRKIFAAGKGMNVSRALHAFDLPTEAFLLLGKENARQYLDLAASYGIPLSYLLTDGAVRENISVNTPASETRICMKNYAVTAAQLTALSALIRHRLSGERDTAAVISGSLPQGITQKDLIGFVAELKSASPRLRLILDCPSLTADTLAEIAPFLIKPNEQEAAALLKIPCAPAAWRLPEEKIQMAEKLRALTHCENTVVSFGAEGAAYASQNGTSGFVTAPSLDGKFRSSVGAGDSMLAGILYGLSHADCADWKHAVSWGVAFGSAACLTEGTCPPEQDAVLRLKKSACPCKRVKCQNHGNCIACREQHKTHASRPQTACEALAAKKERRKKSAASPQT